MDDREENNKRPSNEGHSGFRTTRREKALSPFSNPSRPSAEGNMEDQAAKRPVKKVDQKQCEPCWILCPASNQKHLAIRVDKAQASRAPRIVS